MRTLSLFVGGIVVGLVVHMAAAQNRNTGIVGVNHVGIAVPDLDAALTYYTETLGFPEAFRVVADNGQPVLVYVQVSRETFVELQTANAQRPAGVTHFGIHVEDMDAAIATFRERGANVSDARSGSTEAILSNITDPNGIRIELSELPPNSLQAQAIADWR
jgi:methylmalonyl-CoA/ethylmalonyl-CoA epimerase